MSINTKRQLELTQKRLQELEQLYAARLADSSDSSYGRLVTLRSLRRTINELTEELVSLQAHQKSTSTSE